MDRNTRRSMLLAIVVVGALGLACGEDRAPVAPTSPEPDPDVPEVGGAYEGRIQISATDRFWVAFARVVVVQARNQVTITGTVTSVGSATGSLNGHLEGQTVAVDLAGTVDHIGLFAGTPGRQVIGARLLDLLGCGTKTLSVAVLNFSPQTINFRETWSTTACGVVEVGGTFRA